jgi:hypothetical protein
LASRNSADILMIPMAPVTYANIRRYFCLTLVTSSGMIPCHPFHR